MSSYIKTPPYKLLTSGLISFFLCMVSKLDCFFFHLEVDRRHCFFWFLNSTLVCDRTVGWISCCLGNSGSSKNDNLSLKMEINVGNLNDLIFFCNLPIYNFFTWWVNRAFLEVRLRWDPSNDQTPCRLYSILQCPLPSLPAPVDQHCQKRLSFFVFQFIWSRILSRSFVSLFIWIWCGIICFLLLFLNINIDILRNGLMSSYYFLRLSFLRLRFLHVRPSLYPLKLSFYSLIFSNISGRKPLRKQLKSCFLLFRLHEHCILENLSRYSSTVKSLCLKLRNCSKETLFS